MDRVVLRPPTNKNNANGSQKPRQRRELTVFVVAVATFLSTLIRSSFGHNARAAADSSSSSSWFQPLPSSFILMHVKNSVIITAIILAIYASIKLIWILISRIFGISTSKKRFVEAALEITPLGVQLASVYGNDTNPSDHCRKIRAFLPRQQIIDVIVVEVVQAYCVWTQVAFRVHKMDNFVTIPGGDCCAGCSDKESQIDEQEDTSENQNGDGKSATHSDDVSSSIPDPFEVRQIEMHELLRQNRISIVPAFPNECRGMLSYEQCLIVQAKVEILLGISPDG